MNGFTLDGSGVAKDGISGNADGARIENGTIINFKGIGIHGRRQHVDRREHAGCHGSSVGMAFFQSEAVRVRYSTVALNQGGILCGKSCQLEGNIVSENNGFGLDVTTGAVIGNLIMYNAGQGLIGIHKLGYGQNTIEQNGGKQTDGSFVRTLPECVRPGTLSLSGLHRFPALTRPDRSRRRCPGFAASPDSNPQNSGPARQGWPCPKGDFR